MESAVETEHQRLTKQLCRATWEKGFWQGAHRRMRTVIILAVELIKAGAEPDGILRMLTEALILDDQVNLDKPIKDQNEAKIEYPPDHPAPGDLGSVPL